MSMKVTHFMGDIISQEVIISLAVMYWQSNITMTGAGISHSWQFSKKKFHEEKNRFVFLCTMMIWEIYHKCATFYSTVLLYRKDRSLKGSILLLQNSSRYYLIVKLDVMQIGYSFPNLASATNGSKET